MNFKVYYKDGSTYCGDAFSTPAMNVLLIVEDDKDQGRHIISNGDYYVLESYGWSAVDFVGMVQYLCDKGPRRVLIGVITDNETWNEVWRRANTDSDFPVRTAFGVFERKID